MATTSGIDVSKWQGKIDWQKVKDAGIQFAILRAGYGDTLSYPSQLDETFEYNYSQCKRVGLPVGVYWYSYAVTSEMARQEAKSCIAVLQGKQFEYPIYYDVEEQRIFATGRTSEIMQAFFDEMEAKDFWVGTYTFKSAAENYLSDRIRTRYAMAIAQYNTSCTYNSQYGVWQNSSTLRVNGINTNVDHDYCYVDYPSQIKAKGKNGYKAPEPKLIYKTTKETPIIKFEGTAPANKEYQVYGRKTICGVQYGRVTADGYINLNDTKQVK